MQRIQSPTYFLYNSGFIMIELLTIFSRSSFLKFAKNIDIGEPISKDSSQNSSSVRLVDFNIIDDPVYWYICVQQRNFKEYYAVIAWHGLFPNEISDSFIFTKSRRDIHHSSKNRPIINFARKNMNLQ